MTAFETNDNLVFATTGSGGHLGWFAGIFRPRRWVHNPVLEWFRATQELEPEARVRNGGELVEKDGMWVVAGNEKIGFRQLEGGGIINSQENVTGEGLIQGL
jgi:hypothetical protein